MKKLRRMFPWGVISFATIFLMLAVTVIAAEPRPVVIVSIAPGTPTLKTIDALTAAAGFENAAASLKMQMQMLQGYDWSRPQGLVILADETEFSGYAFLPVSDVKTLPGVGDMLQMATKNSDGSYAIPMPGTGQPVYIKQAGDWAFVSIKPFPANLPSDPTKLLEGLDKKYVIGTKVNVTALPKDLCEGMLNSIRMMAEMNAPDEDAAEMIGNQFDEVTRMMNELKTIVFGIGVTSANDIYVDTFIEALPGTVYATDIQSLSTMKTNNIGFFQPKETAGALIATGLINKLQKQQFETQVAKFFESAREGVEEEGLSDDEIKAATLVLSNLESVIKDTVKAGVIDFGGTWQADGTILASAQIAGGDKLHDSLTTIIATVPEEFKKYVKIDDPAFASDFGDYKVSSFAMPIVDLPDAGEVPPQLQDASISILVGIKDSSLCVAAGISKTVASDLKKAIDASKTSAALPTTNIVFTPHYVGGILELVAPKDLDEAQMVVQAWKDCPEDATVTSTVAYDGASQSVKLVVSNKLLPNIGSAINMFIQLRQTRRNYQFNEPVEIEDINFDN